MVIALSGIELALWDLAGKAAGQPVYRLLGGKFRDRSVCTPTAAGVKTRRARPPDAPTGRGMVEEGFTAMKFDVDDLEHPANRRVEPHSHNAELGSMVDG